jgi:hypothetical protein
MCHSLESPTRLKKHSGMCSIRKIGLGTSDDGDFIDSKSAWRAWLRFRGQSGHGGIEQQHHHMAICLTCVKEAKLARQLG